MRKILFLSVFSTHIILASAQTVGQKIAKAFQQFEADPQLKYAISSLYVIDANTGHVIFDRNSKIGLAGASTQKIVTAATAFDLLGKDYRYKTELGYTGKIQNGQLNGDLIIAGHGDPTLGSPRYDASTSPSVILKEWANTVVELGIKDYNTINTTAEKYYSEAIPDGWIWQDMGNYYGAGAYDLNWRENQYDLLLSSDNMVGGKVRIQSTIPSYIKSHSFINKLKAGEKGSGDNAYIYLYNGQHVVTGTIPRGANNFSVSGAMIDPAANLQYELSAELSTRGIKPEQNAETSLNKTNPEDPFNPVTYQYTTIATHYSPSLDSVIFWFLRRSINLYGEALIKTLAYGKTGVASRDKGVDIIKDLWKQKGIDERELNLSDGSGLSPQNRLTTHAQVEILRYARQQSWFSYFFDALPEYNNMKMKSGTIKNVKGFCGYHKSKAGKQYIFSFLVNNYNGSASALVNKMYKVLDNLK